MSELGFTEDISFAYRQEELLVACTHILFYGMLSSLMIFLVYFHWNSREAKRRSSNVLISLILLLYFFRTLEVALRWWRLWRAFVQNGDTSDDTVVSLFPPYASLNYWIDNITDVPNVLALAIVDSIMIWRCWIICNHAWSSVISQMVLTLGSLAAGLTYIGLSYWPIIFPDKVLSSLLITYIALSVASTILSTLMITMRILRVSRMHGASQSGRLNKVIEIIVESATIYAIASLIFLSFITNLFTGYNDRALQSSYVQVFYAHSVILAPALIMLRVALGQARPDTAWSNNGPGISDIQFNSGPGVAAKSRGAILTIPFSQRDIDIESAPELESPSQKNAETKTAFNLNVPPQA